MKYKLFKVLNHRESKNVYIFDVKLYEEDKNGHKTVVAEGKASANVETKAGQCSVFGDYDLNESEIREIVTICVRRAQSLKEKVFAKE